MLGYWDINSPVETDQNNVKVTAYVKSDKILLSLGNFDTINHKVKLKIDWSKLGLDKTNVKIIAPYIEDFQENRIYNLDDDFEIETKKGLLLEIKY